MKTVYTYTKESAQAVSALRARTKAAQGTMRRVETVALAHMERAVRDPNPLLIALDALLCAAKIHAAQGDGSRIADDYVLGPAWLAAAQGVNGLLCGDFGPADCGTLSAIYIKALAVAGFDENGEVQP